ncbi:MAG: ABC transporter substrate-binding protein [Cyanobacteria bacterium J06632_22]
MAVLGLWATGCAAPVPFDGVELTLWQGIGPPENRQVFQSLVQQFNDTHPGIQVNSRYVGQPDQQIPKILTAVVGNVAPDLLWYVPTLTGQLVELNALQPLDDWWRQSPYAQDLDPALLGTMQFEEHLWSVPFATNNAALFYRPSLFQAAGIAPLPHTWADLREAALRLTQDTNGDGRPDQHGLLLSFGKGEWTVFCWLPLVYSAGGHLAEAGQPDLANGGAIAALDYAQTLLPYARLSAPEQGYDITPLLKGQVAMQVTGPWVLPELDAAGIDYGVLPFPAWDVAHPPTAVLGGENLFFLRGPGKAADPSEATGQSLTKTQAAYQFLDYILSPDFQLPWAIQTGYLPATQSVRQQPTYQAFLAQHPELQIFLNQMTQAKARPVLPKYNQLSQSFGYALEATLLGQSAPAALTEAQQKMEKTNIPNHHRKNQPLHGQ